MKRDFWIEHAWLELRDQSHEYRKKNLQICYIQKKKNTNKKQVKCVLIDLIYVFCNMWGNNTKYQAQDLVDFFIDKIFSKKNIQCLSSPNPREDVAIRI